MPTPQIITPADVSFAKLRKSLRITAIVFILLGALAVLLPNIATIVAEQILGWFLLIWGVAGVMFARSFKGIFNWKMMAAGFVLLIICGLFFLLFPAVGISIMTAFLVGAFLFEGVLSIVMGLRLTNYLPNWQWIMFNGVLSLVLGIIILSQWTESTNWVIGFLVGLNFLGNGITLLFVSRGIMR